MQIHLDEPEGAILAFLTGQEEIELAKAALTAMAGQHRHPEGLLLTIIPLYAALPPDDQTAAFADAPAGTRKVVLSTNIAETSITIDDVAFVIDSGRAKESSYDPHLKIK